jgi:hypothetical protein
MTFDEISAELRAKLRSLPREEPQRTAALTAIRDWLLGFQITATKQPLDPSQLKTIVDGAVSPPTKFKIVEADDQRSFLTAVSELTSAIDAALAKKSGKK